MVFQHGIRVQEQAISITAPITGTAEFQTTLAELFHIMHYRAVIDGKALESAPILLQVTDDRTVYPVMFPLYRTQKLCAGII